MGLSYVSFTLRGGDQSAVASLLKGRDAFVSKKVGDYVLVCDAKSDELIGDDRCWELGQSLSQTFGIRCLAAAVHHDDVFAYHLYDRGPLVDEYVTRENGFEVAFGVMPIESLGERRGGNSRLLCETFQRAEAQAIVDEILSAPPQTDRYLWETIRHADLCNALGMPPFGVCGFHTLYFNGDFPEGMTERDFRYTGTDTPLWKLEKPIRN